MKTATKVVIPPNPPAPTKPTTMPVEDLAIDWIYNRIVQLPQTTFGPYTLNVNTPLSPDQLRGVAASTIRQRDGRFKYDLDTGQVWFDSWYGPKTPVVNYRGWFARVTDGEREKILQDLGIYLKQVGGDIRTRMKKAIDEGLKRLEAEKAEPEYVIVPKWWTEYLCPARKRTKRYGTSLIEYSTPRRPPRVESKAEMDRPGLIFLIDTENVL